MTYWKYFYANDKTNRFRFCAASLKSYCFTEVARFVLNLTISVLTGYDAKKSRENE